MGYDRKFIVPIPAGTIQVKNGNKTYIYHVVKKVYRKDKKNNSDIRVPVGLKVDDTNNMYINDVNFKKYYNAEYEEKFTQEIDSKKLLFSDCITYGQTGVLRWLANSLTLPKLLSNNFDDEEESVSESLLNLAMKFILTQSSSIISYPHFARSNLLLGNAIESDTYIENILGNIKPEDIDSFLDDWLAYTCQGKDLVLSIDGTNIPTEANDIEIVEIGMGKNKTFQKQFALSLVTEQEEFTPIYYKEYQGATHDLEAALVIVETLRKANPKSINFVLDRGYFTANLMRRLRRYGFGFTMMAKENNFIRSVIDLFREEIKDVNNYIPSLDLYGYTYVGNPFDDKGKPLYFHLYYNLDVEKECTKEIHREVKLLEQEAIGLIGKNKEDLNLEKYDKYLTLKFEDDILIKVEIDKEKVRTALKYSGYFTIVSSYITSSEKTYEVYHERDYTEKLIMMMKTYEEFDVVRCHDINHLRGKNLCMFIGLILRNELFKRTKELRKTTKDKKAYTVPEIIRELGCIEATKDKDGTYSNKTAYTKKEKAILKALGMQTTSLDGMLKLFNKSFSIKR